MTELAVGKFTADATTTGVGLDVTTMQVACLFSISFNVVVHRSPLLAVKWYTQLKRSIGFRKRRGHCLHC